VSGNADEAIALVRESLTWIRDLQDKYAFAYALVPLVAAAVLKGDDEWAARIQGARDAVSERTGAQVLLKLVHDLQVQSEREVRARLGPDRWAVAYAAGRRTSHRAPTTLPDPVARRRCREACGLRPSAGIAEPACGRPAAFRVASARHRATAGDRRILLL